MAKTYKAEAVQLKKMGIPGMAASAKTDQGRKKMGKMARYCEDKGGKGGKGGKY